MKALLYLNVHIFKNTVVATIKNPKQVLPALFILLLFGLPFVVFHTTNILPSVSFYTTQTVKPIIFSFLAFIIWMTVFQSITENTLVFSLSEIDFLFPSPLGRKAILLNRMIPSYTKLVLQYLVFIAFMLFLFSAILGFSFWPRILFLWLAISLTMILAFNLGGLISLVSSHFSELKRSHNRRLLSIASIVFLGILLGYTYWYTLEGVSLTEAAIKVLNSTLVRVLLYPIAAASDVAVAWRLTTDVGLKILFLAALCLVTTVGVLSAETHFYEASEATSLKIWKSAQKMRRQEVVVSESFAKRMRKIRPFGRGSTALIWKNLVGMLRDVKNVVPTAFMAVVLFVIVLVREGEFEFFRALFFLFLVVFMCTGYIRWDFRHDLRRIEIIKLIPDSNFRIVLSEIAVPAMFSTVVAYIFLIISFFMFPDTGSKLLLTGFSFAALPVFSVIVAAILNLSTLYYPPQTNNQIIPGVLSVILTFVIVGSSLFVGFVFMSLERMGMGLLLVLFLNLGIALVLLKLLEKKYQFFDLTSS